LRDFSPLPILRLTLFFLAMFTGAFLSHYFFFNIFLRTAAGSFDIPLLMPFLPFAGGLPFLLP